MNWLGWGFVVVLLASGSVAVVLGWEDWRGYAFSLTASMSFLVWGMWRTGRRPSNRAYQADVKDWSKQQRAAGRSSLAVEWYLTRDAFATIFSSTTSRVAVAAIVVLATYSQAREAAEVVRQVAN